MCGRGSVVEPQIAWKQADFKLPWKEDADNEKPLHEYFLCLVMIGMSS